MKDRFLFFVALCGSLLGSTALSLGAVGASFNAPFFGLAFFWWISLGAFFVLLALAALHYALREKKSPPPLPPNFPEFEKFMKESKLSFRGHLKLSILFWILAYRKEKAKSFEDAKKEIFLEVKKEIPHVRWMDSILSEIQDELSKIK